MAEITTIARPYAKAAFAYAREQNVLARWSGMLALAAAVASEARMAAHLSRPQLTAQQQAEDIAKVCGDQLTADGKNFIRQLCGNRRLNALPVVAAQFEQMVSDLQNIGDVKVVSAFPLTSDELEKLTASLKRRFAQDVRVEVTVDPALMGGIVVRFGDQVIDGSVRSRLAKLANTLNS